MEIIPGADGKVCSWCGEVKPPSEYYVKDKLSGRLFSWCKACHIAKSSEYIKKHPERYAEHARNAYQNDPETHRERSRKWRERNPEKSKEANQAYDTANRGKRAEYRKATAEKRRAYNKAYREANAEKVKASNAAYREARKQELRERERAWRLANPERYREIRRKYRQANTDTVNAWTHKRRARIKGNGGSYTAAEWEVLKAVCEYQCLMCGKAEPEIKLTVDHIVPVSEGGPNTIDNIQPLCKSCNSKKHRKSTDLRKLDERKTDDG